MSNNKHFDHESQDARRHDQCHATHPSAKISKHQGKFVQHHDKHGHVRGSRKR